MRYDNARDTLNKELYDIANSFKSGKNIDYTISKCIDFYEGRQYDTENFGNVPRLTLNICKQDVNIKASKLNGTKTYIQFTCSDSSYDCTTLQHFDEHQMAQLSTTESEFYSAINGLVKGTEILYMLYDENATYTMGIYRGGLIEEHIDPRNFYVANPLLHDLQSQKWVMFTKEEEIGALREILEYKDDIDREEKLELLTPDGMSTLSENEINHTLVKTYTRFFRVDNEVFFMVSTDKVDLFLYPKAMNPNLNKSIGKKLQEDLEKHRKKMEEGEYDVKDIEYSFDIVEDFDIDYERTCIPLIKFHELNDSEYYNEKNKWTLYPFADFIPQRRDDMYYGDSEILNVQSSQRAVNFILSMMLMATQNNAYNKVIVKEGAIRQPITNKPSEVIYDYSKGNTFGIKFAESQPIPNELFNFAHNLVQITKDTNGFGDIVSGQSATNNMSGYALQLATKLANTMIEQQQNIFWNFKKKKAQIRLLFYKFYVDLAQYTFELEDYEISRKESARKELLNRANRGVNGIEYSNEAMKMLHTPTRRVQVREFNGANLKDKAFDISVEVMAGLQNSELSESEMWNNLIMNGNMDKLAPEMLELYLQCNPAVSQANRNKARVIVQKRKQEENYQLRQQNMQLVKALEQLGNEYKQVNDQLKYVRAYNDNLTKEFTDKLNTQNKVIERLQGGTQPQPQQQSFATQNGVSEGEVKSNNSRGINGTSFQ